MDALTRQVIEALRDASRVLWITGAGVSADSGLPTYRGVGGLYEGNDTVEGMPIEVALSGEVFRRRPDISWKYILQIENAVRGARPNRAHEVIAASEKRFERVTTLTQNVDGFHRLAGSQNLIDIHGDLQELYCTQCSWRERVQTLAHIQGVPTCTRCGGTIRPDVVLFGEMLPTEKLRRLDEELRAGFDIIFSVGTTSGFPYIAQPVIDATRAGTLTVEINPSETEVSRAVSIKLSTRAADTLDRIWNALSCE